MKIKIIFWGNEPLGLNTSGVKVIQDLKLERYYEKASSHLYEYVRINKEQVQLLYQEGKERCKAVILVVMGKLSSEDIGVIKKLQIICPNKLHIFIKQIEEALTLYDKEIKKCYNYMPGMKVAEIPELFPIFLAHLEEELQDVPLYTLRGNTLAMGYGQFTNGLGQLVEKIFEHWQYICQFTYVKLNLYSQQELGIVEISELEDIFNEYTAENAKLTINWYKSYKVDEKIYFLLEGHDHEI